jgi:hypothetical protein
LQVLVDRFGGAPLGGLVRDDVGGRQPFQEPGEPRVARLERAELLEQLLGRPVGVAEDVLADLLAQAGGTEHQPVERAAQVPQALQQAHEPLGRECQVVEVEGPGDVAPGLLGYLDGALRSPQHVLERVAVGGAQPRGQVAGQDPLGHRRKAGVVQGGEAAFGALALGVPFFLARGLWQAEPLARRGELPVRVAVGEGRDDVADELAQQRQVHAARHHRSAGITAAAGGR